MKNLKASLIVDLLGNISSKSRQWSQDLGAFSHAGQRGLGGVGTAVRRLGGDAEISSSRMRQAFRGMRSGMLAVSADMDRLKLSAEGVFGSLTRLYGLMTGGAAIYGFKKAFIDPAAAMENYTIRLNSINHGDTAKTEATKAWVVQNAKDTTWGLAGVMQEYTSSRSFGMNDSQAKKFITMLQDQGGYHGWSLPDAQGASLQLKQMYARQSIQAQDANLLTGYGINVYQLLADKLKVDQKVIRDKGERGLLGPDAIRLLFQVMAEQAAGAQKNAMNSWTGLTSQMGDVWDQFARKVMDTGPFSFLKTQMSGILEQIADMQKDGSLDGLANDIGQGMLTTFTTAKDAVKWLVAQIKAARAELKKLRDAGYGNTLDNIADGAKKLAKYLLYMYLVQKSLRLARAVGMGALRLGATPLRYTLATVGAVTSPFRKRQPVIPGELPGRGGRFMNFLSGVNPAAVQPVFVTNWPAGALAGAGGNGGNTLIEEGGSRKRRSGRTKKGPGKGRGISTVVTAGEELAESAARKGLFGRAASRVGGWFGKIPGLSKAGSLLSAAGSKLGLGKVAGWLGKGGKLLGRFGGGALGAALTAAPVLLDDQATTHDKGAAVGSGIGMVAGGALGSFAGPVGTMIGSTVGSYLGEYLGGWLTDAYQKITGGNDNGSGQSVQKAAARVELVAPEGWDKRSIDIDDSDMFGLDLNFYSGGNYVPYG
ncbi:tape measure protein [Salmonella enterica]|nr:tape measure protein [Salmonella enterica]